jgi:hypothetical protein
MKPTPSSIEEKIREIVEARTLHALYTGNADFGQRSISLEQAVKELTTLITSERKEAVEDYKLNQEYFSEFKVIDGLNQHPSGLNFEQYLSQTKGGIEGKEKE